MGRQCPHVPDVWVNEWPVMDTRVQGQFASADGAHHARPLVRHRLLHRRRHRLRHRLRRRRQRITTVGSAIEECRMQFPRPCVASRIRIVEIAMFVGTVESSPNRIACETTPSARELPAFLAAHVGPMVCAWAAPRRIPRGWRACHGVNAHCQRFMCERHTRPGAVAPTTQTTLPTTPRCRRLSPRWFATWAPRCPEARPHRQ